RRRAVGRAPRDPGGALGVRFGRAGRRTVARRGWPPPAPGRDRRRGARRGRAAMTVGDESTAEVPADLVDRVRARLAGLGVEPEPDEVVRAVRAESGALHGHLDLLRTARLVREHLAGAGPLEALLASPGVTDVVVDGPGPALVDRGAGRETTDVEVSDERELRALAVRLAGRAGERVDAARPWAAGVVRSRGAGAARRHASCGRWRCGWRAGRGSGLMTPGRGPTASCARGTGWRGGCTPCCPRSRSTARACHYGCRGPPGRRSTTWWPPVASLTGRSRC